MSKFFGFEILKLSRLDYLDVLELLKSLKPGRFIRKHTFQSLLTIETASYMLREFLILTLSRGGGRVVNRV